MSDATMAGEGGGEVPAQRNALAEMFHSLRELREDVDALKRAAEAARVSAELSRIEAGVQGAAIRELVGFARSTGELTAELSRQVLALRDREREGATP